MSIKRINSTGRGKIVREDARVFIRAGSDGIPVIDATINLAEYGLPDDGMVFLEAYRQTTLMRFPHGTVAVPRPPREVTLRLTKFTSPDGLLFRVKVTSTGERAGVLLAEADRIPVSADDEQPNDRIPLLPTAPDDLGQEAWRVDLNGASGPLLLVNNRVGDWKAVASSPLFRALVYPAVMRQVLWYIHQVEEMRHMDDQDDWRCRWLRFAAALPGVAGPPLSSVDEHEWEQWITDAVESFCRQHQMLNRYLGFFTAEASA